MRPTSARMLWVAVMCAWTACPQTGGGVTASDGATREAGSASDGAVESGLSEGDESQVDGGTECERSVAAFDEFVDAHSACARNEDCAMIGDCGPNADFVAVRVEVVDEAYALMQARSCGGGYDGPVYHAICAQGRCGGSLLEGAAGCGGVAPESVVQAEYVLVNETADTLHLKAIGLDGKPTGLLVSEISQGSEATIFRAVEGEVGGALLSHFLNNLVVQNADGTVVYEGIRQDDWEMTAGGFRLTIAP